MHRLTKKKKKKVLYFPLVLLNLKMLIIFITKVSHCKSLDVFRNIYSNVVVITDFSLVHQNPESVWGFVVSNETV